MAYLNPRRRFRLSVLMVLIGLLLIACAAFLVGKIGSNSSTVGNYIGTGVVIVAALLCLLRAVWVEQSARVWWFASGGLALSAVGFFLDALTGSIDPDLEDLLYLAGYIALGVAVVSITSERQTSRRAFWFDCCDAALIVAALTAATLGPLALSWAESDGVGIAIPTLGYPLIDALLVTLLVVSCATTGWRPGRSILTLTAALLLLGAADDAYFITLRDGSYQGGAIDFFWYAAMAGIGLAAWQPEPYQARSTSRPSTTAIGLPVAAATVGLGVLIAGSIVTLPLSATIFAALAAIGSGLRLAITFLDVRGLADDRRLTITDRITELPTESLYMRELDRALRSRSRSVAVMLIDLDGFDELSNTLGYGVADAALVAVARHLRAVADSGDCVARIGPHLFALMLPGRDRVGSVEVAQRLRARLDDSIEAAGVTLRLHVNIGVALAPAQGSDPELLLRGASRALGEGPRSPESVRFFDGKLEERGEQLKLAGELNRALVAEELQLFLQPVADMASGRVHSAEALVRWDHPELGLLTPDRFLPMVAQTDLASRFSRYVIERGVRHSVELRRAGREISVSINLTPADILDETIPAFIADALRRHGAEPTDLSFEVTESGVLSDFDRARRSIEAIRATGLRVAFDDFGTGHSSLAHLLELPVDALKLDRSFVAEITGDGRSAAIVRGMIELAHALGMRVVAEGVETPGQWRRLTEWHCDTAQGWLLSAPVRVSELEGVLTAVTAAARSSAGDGAAGVPGLSSSA